MKHHGAWSWITTCTIRDTQKNEVYILSCVSMRVIHVSFFSTPYQMCRWTGVHCRHPFWCVVFTPSLDSSPLGLMVIESWLTHIFFGCIACMSNGWFIVTPFYRLLYCTCEGAATNRSITLPKFNVNAGAQNLLNKHNTLDTVQLLGKFWNCH